MAASSPKTLLEQGHQLRYLPHHHSLFSPRRAATGASALLEVGQGQAGRPSCGGWNWTTADHLTLPGLKDCLGLETAGDGGVCFRL